MKIAVIQYNAGNVRSVLLALKRLGYEGELTDDPVKIRRADKVIFPGVGEAASTMRFLRAKGLNKIITALEQPVLGICLGLQLLCRDSAENNTECLKVFDSNVVKLVSTGEDKLKIPHMGWNNIHGLKGDLFHNVPEESQVYFVHSYAADLSPQTSAVCEYTKEFSAALQDKNFYAVQFHPEKSSEAGEQILKNFINI